MRSILLILLFVNLVLFASQFDVVRGLFGEAAPQPRPAQINAERLRIVRDTSSGPGTRIEPAPAAEAADATTQPPTGTNSR